MRLLYPYTVEQQEDGKLLVQFLDFEEAFTEGETLEEAAFNASEVLSGIMGYRLDHGQDVPLPTDVSGENIHHAAPDSNIQAALLVRLARGDKPLADLARALGTSWPAAQRLENPRHFPTLKQLDRAAAALGKRLVLEFV